MGGDDIAFHRGARRSRRRADGRCRRPARGCVGAGGLPAWTTHGLGIRPSCFTPFPPDFATRRYDALLADAVARVAAVREAVGSGIDIGVEIHRRLSVAEAIALAAELE